MRISLGAVSPARYTHTQTDRRRPGGAAVLCAWLTHTLHTQHRGCTNNPSSHTTRPVYVEDVGHVFVRKNESRRETGPRDYKMTHKNHIHNNSSVSFKFSPPNCSSSRSLTDHIFAAVSLVFFLLVPSSLRLSPTHPHHMDRLRTILFHTPHPPVVIHSSLFICGDLDCLYFV